MLFNSISYAVFLPVVFVIHWALPHKYRWSILLLFSWYFYMSWNAKYLGLIIFATMVSYFAAIIIERKPEIKKAVLALSVIMCLMPLFVFKYFDFVSESISQLTGREAVTLKLLLPVGISFYTFQTLSYIIDVYKGQARAEYHFGIYAAFISFFPQLVAGPIERTTGLLPQIKQERVFSYEKATYGLKLMTWGFFKKLVIADNFAVFVDAVYSDLAGSSGFELLCAIFMFSLQIYCDFSGYSDIAIGSAKLLGIDLMTNFKSPYFSESIKEFWSRWHISLSSWFKDYVYIPLGGNRKGEIKRDVNLIITFLLSGLWHGASWTFIFWGGLHGVARIAERHIKIRLPGFVKRMGVFLFACVAWVFFRAESFKDAGYVLVNAVTGPADLSSYFANNTGAFSAGLLGAAVATVVLYVYDRAALKTDPIMKISSMGKWHRHAVYIAMLLAIVLLMAEGETEFVYFQF